MKSLLVFTVLLIVVCSLCDPTRSSPSAGRVRRQGWAWGGDNNDRRPSRPTRQTNAPTAATTPSTTAAAVDNGDVTTTTASPQFTACFNRCQSTLQYNPVCGSNRVTYDNEGRLNCARRCGVDVTLLFMGTCSPVSK